MIRPEIIEAAKIELRALRDGTDLSMTREGASVSVVGVTYKASDIAIDALFVITKLEDEIERLAMRAEEAA